MIRAALRSPFRIALLASLSFRVLTGWRLSTRPTDLNVGDPGQWIDAGDRILRGEWPFRDWTGIYGPLLYGWGAGWYGILGADWRAALQMLELVSPVACLLLAAITAKFMLPNDRWRAGFIIAVAVLGLDAFYWSPGIRIWAPVAALAWAAHPPKRMWSWLPFLACGLTPWLSPDTGIPCIVTALLCIGRRGIPLRLAVLMGPLLLLPIHGILDLASVASWIWGTPFPGDAFPARRIVFLLPIAFTLGAGIVTLWRLRRSVAADRGARWTDLALWVLSAGCLRSLLGRTDTAHLLFVLPPLLLLAFRFASSVRVSGVLAIVLFTAPFMWLSAIEGPARRAIDAWRSDVARDSVAGERIALPAGFATHLARVTTAARGLLSADDPVLSLPGPIYAHLLRRPQALPWAVPELMGITQIDWSPPRVVIVDPALALAWDPYFLPSPGGPLTWSTPADEPITRGLRETLRRWYDVRTSVDGARILVRRTVPRPARRESVMASLTPTGQDLDTVVAGNATSLDARGISCDEIRTFVGFSYAPGLSTLAKSYMRVTAIERSGRTHEMVQPLPPARLGLELHWPVPRVPLDRIVVEAGNPGSFNPRPVRGEFRPVRLVRFRE